MHAQTCWQLLAGDVQGSEEAGGSKAFVIVSSALGLAGQHRKDSLTTAQHLNLTLLSPPAAIA